MATPAEKKALLFLGALIMLGGVVRLWRADGKNRRSSKPNPAVVSDKGSNFVSNHRSSTSSGAKKSSQNKAGRKPAKRTPKPNPEDLTEPVDLDLISLPDLAATGIVKPSIARMIIANRDSFGPFGSIVELQRIPYLRKTTITSLAPYVTFSRVPRPSNAVVRPRGTAPDARNPKASRPKRRSP